MPHELFFALLACLPILTLGVLALIAGDGA
jgi:hypothetical protein